MATVLVPHTRSVPSAFSTCVDHSTVMRDSGKKPGMLEVEMEEEHLLANPAGKLAIQTIWSWKAAVSACRSVCKTSRAFGVPPACCTHASGGWMGGAQSGRHDDEEARKPELAPALAWEGHR